MTPLDGDILGPDDERTAKTDEASVRAGFWKTFARAARFIPFADDVVAAYYCALDPRTPNRSRLTLLGALAYFVMPADAVPDFVAFLGFTDDAAVLAMALGSIRAHMTDAHRSAARKALADMAEGKARR